MTKYQSLRIYGILMMLTGVTLLVSQTIPLHLVRYLVAFFMLGSAVFAGITAYKSSTMEIRFKYHELHALGMAVYGIFILFFSNDLGRFLNITAFFFIYYGMTELILCFQLLNQRERLSMQVLVVRIVFGFLIYLGAPIILSISDSDQNTSLLGYGIVFVLSGIHIMMFKTVIKRLETPQISNASM
jgi:uncharacterized membrane protein HdeD (DUF308 family)